jgi:hypothetical protein
MKKSYFIVLFVLLSLSSCMSSLYRNLPEGTYSSNDHYISLGSDGTFLLENIGNVNDGRDFSLEGTYTSTRDKIDQDNDSYGKITFTVGSMHMDGAVVNSIYLDEDGLSVSSKVTSGDVLEGWWAYSENITWGGMMRIWFNWPGIPRGNNFYDGHNELFSGDPA